MAGVWEQPARMGSAISGTIRPENVRVTIRRRTTIRRGHVRLGNPDLGNLRPGNPNLGNLNLGNPSLGGNLPQRGAGDHLGRFVPRQPEPDAGALADRTLYGHEPAGLAHDALHGGKPQPAAAAFPPCGEERLEHPRQDTAGGMPSPVSSTPIAT